MVELLSIVNESVALFTTFKDLINDLQTRISNFQSNSTDLSSLDDGLKRTASRLEILATLFQKVSPNLSDESQRNWETELGAITTDVRHVTIEAKQLLHKLDTHKLGRFSSPIRQMKQSVMLFSKANTIADDVKQFSVEARRLFDTIFERVDRLEGRHESRITNTALLSTVPVPYAPAGTPSTFQSVQHPFTPPTHTLPDVPGKIYTVKTGDTLWRIALNECGNPGRYQEILDVNKSIISNQERLRIGTQILIPEHLLVSSAPEGLIYVVRAGETLSDIAQHIYGDPAKFKTIFEANRNILDDPDTVFPDMKLCIPTKGAIPT